MRIHYSTYIQEVKINYWVISSAHVFIPHIQRTSSRVSLLPSRRPLHMIDESLGQKTLPSNFSSPFEHNGTWEISISIYNTYI